MIEIIITPSKKSDKKFDATIDGKKTVSFGAKGYSDFTQHKDPARKQRYLKKPGIGEKIRHAATNQRQKTLENTCIFKSFACRSWYKSTKNNATNIEKIMLQKTCVN